MSRELFAAALCGGRRWCGAALAGAVALRASRRRAAATGRCGAARPDRNMVSAMKGLPLDWDVKTKKNVKWVADLGSQSYGNPVVAGGMVFVGTNNELARDPKQPGDRGVLMAFREATGEFLWQHAHAEARIGPRQRLAVPGRGVVAAGDRRPPLLRQQPRRGVLPRHPGLPRQRERRREGREADRHDRRRRGLGVRHDGGSGRPIPTTCPTRRRWRSAT